MSSLERCENCGTEKSAAKDACRPSTPAIPMPKIKRYKIVQFALIINYNWSLLTN